ncbi:MAG: class D sortase [Saccharofermentans sp.]|nr:class D sortase [Saccharofermentans sp.]
MYKHDYINKKRLISNILLVLAIVLLMVGIVFIAADIAKRNLRQEKIDQGTVSMDRAIAENMAAQATASDMEEGEEPVVTMLVGTSDLEISGEDYDYFGTEEEIAAQREAVQQELELNEDGYAILQGVGILDIPCIELHIPIWQTTNSTTLRYGTGHYVGSVMPGQQGNCSILGHHMRKYGSIFNRLGEVEIGDEITITNLRGYTYTYIVDEILIVEAEELGEYLRGGITDTRQVTLVTCEYTNQGKKRLVVIGHIQEVQDDN